MLLKSLKFASAGALLAGSLTAVGCAERTDLEDVQAAREAVREEQHETAEVRQEAAEDIAEAEREESVVRHEAMRPVTGDDGELQDARQETAETRQEAAEAIQEEQQETAEAQAELRQTEAEYKATQARDKFVADHQQKLDAAAARIEALNDRAGNEEGATKEATARQAAELQTAHERAEEALDNVESAELMKWSDHQENVKQAFDALQAEMDQSA